jgi:hypothetical protein
MTPEQADDFRSYLINVCDQLEDNAVEWVAISVKYNDGSRIAVHSEEAPDRPRGMSRGP